MLFLSSSLFLVFAAPLSASALVSQADSLTDSSCHSDAAASAYDAAAEAYSANPAVVFHAASPADSHPDVYLCCWVSINVCASAYGDTAYREWVKVTLKLLFGNFNAMIRGLYTVEDESLPNTGLSLIIDPELLLILEINYAQHGPNE